MRNDENDISKRQQDLLKAIITEFIETAEAVGSINLLDKYHFSFSSATIRNEMAELVFRGYLYKKHSSAGRIPTTKGWKFFVEKVKNEINYIDATKAIEIGGEISSNIAIHKGHIDQMIRESLNFLSTLAENASVALIGNDLFYSGLSNLTDIPELKEGDNLRRILKILEDYYTLSEVFHKKQTDDEINILIGEEDTGKMIFKDYSVIFTELKFETAKGFIAVIGPNRMDYKKIISAVKYVSQTIKKLID